jgi:hypothetical protein
MLKFWKFLQELFLEGMLLRKVTGEKLGFFSLLSWGSNMMFAGLLGFLIATVWFVQRAHFELDAHSTISEVLEVIPDEQRDGPTVYALKLKWVDHLGTTHVTVPMVSSSSYDVPVGSELDISYDPNDPNDVRVQTVKGPWYFPKLILLGSALSLLFGWFVRGRAQRKFST